MNQLERERETLHRGLRELHEPADDTAACPDAGVLWDSAVEGLDREPDRTIIEHLSTCAACGQAWELARTMHRSESGHGSVEAGSRKRSRAAFWPFLAAAAALLGAIGLWTVDRPTDSPTATPVYRDSAAGWLVSMIDENVPLPRADCRLSWASGPTGTTYDLVVMNEQGELLAQAWGLDAGWYQVVADRLEGIQSGGTILWQVTAHLPDETEVTSVTFVSRLE